MDSLIKMTSDKKNNIQNFEEISGKLLHLLKFNIDKNAVIF